MADKKQKKLGDYIMVEMAKGAPAVEIKRQNMTDEEWERVKKKARDTGTLVEDLSDKPQGASPEDQKRIDEMGAKLEKARREKIDRENPDLLDLRPEASADPGMSVRGNMQRLVTGAAPKGRPSPHEKTRVMPEVDLRPAGSDAHQKTRVMPEVDISPTNEITQEDVDAFEAKKALENSVKENEAAAQMKEGLDFTTPESNLAAAAHKRAGEPPSYTEVEDNQDTSVSPAITDNNDTSVAPIAKPLQFGQDALSAAAAGEGVDNTPPASPDDIMFDGSEQPTGPNPVERFLLPKTTALAEYKEGDPTGATPPAKVAGVQPPSVAPPVAAPPPGTGTPPQGPGGSLAVSMKRTRPGAVPPSNDADYFKAERESMETATRLQKDAAQAKADAEKNQNLAERNAIQDKIDFTAKNEKMRLDAQNTYEESLRNGEMALNGIIDERRALMNQRVDPDAYYTKGGVGKAVLNTISGTLFGWIGQGMQFLQRMDSLAQQEVKNQQDELARKSGELGAMADDKRNVIALARQRGLSAIESVAAARVAFYQGVQDQLAKAAADNPQFQAIADQKIAELEMGKAKDLMTLKQAGQAEAHRKVIEQQGWAKLAQEREELAFKMGKDGEGGQKLKPQQTARLAEIFNSSKQMADMMKNYREKTGVFSGLTQFAPAGSTDASKWRQARRGYSKSIGRGIEGGKMTDKDEESILESYIPTGEDVEGNVTFKGQRLARYAADKYRSELEAFGAGDYRSHGLPSPEQFEAHLLKEMGLSGGTPSYATPRN